MKEILGNSETDKKTEIEIERKWSVYKEQIPDLANCDKIEVEQGYFKDHDGKNRRLRKYTDKTGTVFYQMQKKTKLGAKRSSGSEEETRYMSEGEFSILWPLTVGMRIFKTRYYIPHIIKKGGQDVELKIELDFFHTPENNKHKKSKEIIMAEIEFTSKEQSDWFTRDIWPSWFKKDITDKKDASSKSIAKKYGKS